VNQRELRINTEVPSKSDVLQAMKSLRNGKAPEVERIPPEVLKVDPHTTTELFYPVIKKIWAEERMPEDLRKGILIKIPKKGTLSECNNWRGITLLSVPSKIKTLVILNRIREKIDQRLKKEQAGFRACSVH
jgi:hypothetical protein